jgi:hypothetical protein
MDPRNAQKQDDRDIVAGNVREGGVKNINSQFGTTSESQFDSNAAGYNLNPSAQFFERIDYVLYHGNKGVQYSIINPMMSEFKPGNIDYGSSDVQEFSMSFDYERFTVYNKLNFELGADDVDRFEQLGAISGDLFEDDVAKPLVLETGRTLDILGTEEEQRERTLQPTIAKEQPADPGGTDASNSGDTQEDTAQEGNGDETDETSTEPVEGVPGTYAAEYDPNQMAGATGGDGEGGLFSDILGDVADSALSAVLRGQNVKDAILTTAVNRVSTSLGESINESISPSDAIKKESPNQSTDTNPGDS